MVPKAGFEPARPRGHSALNAARLPVPPLRHFIGATIIITQIPAGVKRGYFSISTTYLAPYLATLTILSTLNPCR